MGKGWGKLLTRKAKISTNVSLDKNKDSSIFDRATTGIYIGINLKNEEGGGGRKKLNRFLNRKINKDAICQINM